MKNQKKFNFIFLLIAIILFSFIPFIPAQGEVCCEQLKTGEWCQNAPVEECAAGSQAPTSCDQTAYCQLGTCIDTNKGLCMPNTPKSKCENEGGSWDIRDKNEIEICQTGCCLVGEDVAFVTQTECRQLATDYGVNTTFRDDINDEATCFQTATPNVLGACVFDESRDCSVITKEDCLSREGNFNEGLLCTATQLETNCAKTQNTQCFEGKVYFKDSCNNLANIYDSSMFSENENEWNAEMQDYWRFMKESDCEAAGNYESCGNCNYIAGSICREYKRNDPSTLKPDFGQNVCADLSCQYDTNNDGEIGEGELYQHGESWCAESNGILNHIKVDSLTGEFQSEEIRNELLNSTKYNLPGSRYYKLNCVDGEVLVEPCRDYRNEYCVESSYEDSGFRLAQCRANNWRGCFNSTTKTTCEDTSQDCKWIPGYRYDGEIKTTEDNRNHEEQGSCVPLYSPGFDFWNEGNDGIGLCSSGAIEEPVIYETLWTTKRDNFEDVPPKDAAERCFENCYLIPGYGEDVGAELMEKIIWAAKPMGRDLSNYFVSLRAGHYCDNSDFSSMLGGDGQATGKVYGNRVDCADNRGRNFPIFFTHTEWLTSIRDKTRSTGDCGYTTNFIGQEGNPEAEIVTAIFQQLEQDMTNVKVNTSVEKIYVGDERLIEYRE